MIILLYFFYWFSLLLSTQSNNAIDNLKTDADVIAFYSKVFPKRTKKLELLPYYNETTHVADSLGAKNWIKMDFDHNGETDLLIFRQDGITDMEFILSEKGVFSYIKPEYAEKFQFLYPVLRKIGNQSFVLLYSQNQVNYDPEHDRIIYTKLACDTLAFKYRRVVNYSSWPNKCTIEQVIIDNNGSCEGDCPKTTVIIDAKHLSSTATKWEDNGKIYRGALRQKNIILIISLLNYADFTRFTPEYHVRATDQTTTTLTVVYDGGKKKIIKDYGSTGTFTLAEIYKLTYGINWVAVR